MPLEALFDSVIVKMDVKDTIIEMPDDVAAKTYSEADKVVIDIGPEFEGDLKAFRLGNVAHVENARRVGGDRHGQSRRSIAVCHTREWINAVLELALLGFEGRFFRITVAHV